MGRQRVDFTPSGNPVTHGSVGGYSNHGCGCDLCRATHRARIAKRRAERRREAIPDFVIHGTPSTYANWACRCDECTTANTIAKRPT